MASEWFCKIKGQEYGPMASAELKKLAESGRLTRADLIRKGREGAYIPAANASGLFSNAPIANPRLLQANTSARRAGSTDIPQAKAEHPAAHDTATEHSAAAAPHAATRPTKPSPSHAAPTPEVAWYYSLNGVQQGPVGFAMLQQLTTGGQLGRHEQVWSEGLGNWTPAGAIGGLQFPAVAATTAVVQYASYPAAPYGTANPYQGPAAAAYPQGPNAYFAGEAQRQVVIQNTIVNQQVVYRASKSIFVAMLLAFFFGPLGMLYSTVGGALCMFLVNLVLIIPTAGFIILLTWPLGVVWAGLAAASTK